MNGFAPKWKPLGLPMLKRAIASGKTRQSFIKLFEILLAAGMPRSAIVHENIPGGLPESPDVRERGATSLSYVTDCRFILTLAGEHRTIRELANRRRDIVVRPGQLCWMPADSWYLVRNGPARTMLSVIFQNDRTRFVWFHNMPFASANTRPSQILLSYQTRSASSLELAHALALMQIARPAATGVEPDAHVLAASARALLAWCLRELRDDRESVRNPPPQADTGGRLVDEINAYVNDHLQGDLSRERVAAVFGISPDHLTRLFRVHADDGFSEFVTAARLRFAEQLLAKSKLSVKEIGSACGFNSSAYFVKRFREYHGLTPLGWKEAQRPGPSGKPV